MGIVQSCCGSRTKEEVSEYDKSYQAQIIDGKIKRKLERYSELYEALEHPDGSVKIIINDQEYVGQLPLIYTRYHLNDRTHLLLFLIQDEVIVMDAKSPRSRSFIRNEALAIVNNVNIQSVISQNNSVYYSSNFDQSYRYSNANNISRDHSPNRASMYGQKDGQINKNIFVEAIDSNQDAQDMYNNISNYQTSNQTQQYFSFLQQQSQQQQNFHEPITSHREHEHFESEMIGTNEDEPEEIKKAQIVLENIDIRPPPKLSLDAFKSQKAQMYQNGGGEKLEASSDFKISSNMLSIPTKSQQKKQQRILKMQTGAGLKPDYLESKQITNKSKNNLKYDANMLHFAYIFASPLVMELSKGAYVEDKLDEISFKAEFENIKESLQKKNLHIRYSYTLGTNQNMPDVLEKNLLALHFSGHGLINDKASFKGMGNPNVFDSIGKKGDILVMEGEQSGNSDFFFGNDLNRLLAPSQKTKFKFVIVASCHSEKIGEIFKKNGAEHVICVKKEKQLNDRAAVVFAKEFYRNVFRQDFSICQAYERALLAIENTEGLKGESKLYVMFKKDQEKHICHEGEMLEYVKSGEIQCINDPVKLQILPSNPTNWIPRSLDMFHCILKLFSDDCRIVQVFGVPGSGKSALIKKTANYLAERRKYPGGIIYSNFQNIKSVREAFIELIDTIESEKEYEDRTAMSYKDVEDRDIFTYINQVSRGHLKILFVLDNLDEIIANDRQRFIKYLEKIVNRKENIRILFSASVCLEEHVEGFVVKNVNRLIPKKARDLFIRKIPLDEARDRVFSFKSMKELETFTRQEETINLILKQLPHMTPQKILEGSFCKKEKCTLKNHTSSEICASLYLEKHPFFEILSQPLPLCLAAAQLKNQKLTIKDIFENLLNTQSNNGDFDDQLIVFYMSVFKMLRKTSPLALEILYVLSQTSSGLIQVNIEKLFEIDSNTAQKCLDLLVESSLVINEDETIVNYKIQNIIGKFVELSLKDNEASRIKYNRMLASFYLDFLTVNKKRVNDGDIKIEDLVEMTVYHEKNIIKCLQYLISLRFPQVTENEYGSMGTLKQQDQLITKNVAKILAKKLTSRFNNKQKSQESSSKKRGRFQSMKQTIQSDIIELVMEPLKGDIDKYIKQRTFVKRNQDIDVAISPTSNRKKEKEDFIKEVKNQIQLELANQESQKSIEEILEVEEGQSSQSDGQDEFQQQFDKQIEEANKDIAYSDYELSDDEVKNNNNHQNNKQTDPQTEIDKSQEKLAISRDQFQMPMLEVLGPQDTWKKTRKSKESPELNQKPSWAGEIQVSSLELSNSHKSQKVSDNNLFSRNDLNINTGIQIHKATSSVGSKKSDLKLSNIVIDNKIQDKNSLSLLNKDKGMLMPRTSLKVEQILSVIKFSINKKLAKLNDKVSDKDKKQYDETVQKFSQFINKMMIKPSEKVDQFINNQESRQWSRRPTGRQLKRQVSSVNPGSDQYHRQVSVSNKNGDKLGSSPPQKDSIEAPVQQYGSTLGTELLPQKQPKRQSTKIMKKPAISKQQSSASHKNENNSPPTLTFEQIRSNTDLEVELGRKIQEPDDFDIDFEIEDLSDGELVADDDGYGEMQILLYHFMSVQAIRNREIQDFMSLKEQFKINQMDQLFQASIELLVIYQNLRNKVTYINAANDLENILNQYKLLGSMKGQAIACFFLAYVYKNYGSFLGADSAKFYLEQAHELFKLDSDEEGKMYCERFKYLLNQRETLSFSNKKTQVKDQVSIDSLSNISPIDIRSPSDIDHKCLNTSAKSFSNKLSSAGYSNNSYRYRLINDKEAFNLLLNPVDLNKIPQNLQSPLFKQ